MDKEDCLKQTKQSQYRMIQKIAERPDNKSSYYLAEDTEWQRLVGIKAVQKTKRVEQKEQIKLLMKVAENTPFVPRVYEVLEDDEQVYIIMEHIMGHTLQQFMEENPSKVKEMHAIMMKKLMAILLTLPCEHRDIKPANIIVRKQDSKGYFIQDIFLIDFGLSALYPFANEGTNYYQAPEQKQETEFTIKANAQKQIDIFACGMMLLELLLGSKPVEGKNYSLLENAEEWTVFEELREKGVSEEEVGFIQKCVQPDPVKRVKTIREMMFLYRNIK